jgi:hypothetical protein
MNRIHSTIRWRSRTRQHVAASVCDCQPPQAHSARFGAASPFNDSGEFVERRPRLAERRSELTEDGGDGGALGEQRLAGVEQTLGIGSGESSADGE